ncbi:MAG: hypothetical protein AB1465_00005, partial [Patescibacteria group bacterium]
WFAPLIAALVGAAIGVATAAIVGQSLWQGALVGAIGGLAFNGVGSLMLKGIAQTAAHGFAGAAVGAIGGAIEGGDVGRGALVGLFSASIANGLGQAVQAAGILSETGSSVMGEVGNFTARTGIGAVVGGATSAAFGGSFGQGAAMGAMTAGIGYLTNHLEHSILEFKSQADVAKYYKHLLPDYQAEVESFLKQFSIDPIDGSRLLEPLDFGMKDLVTFGSSAKFQRRDLTSYLFPGTNYCGWTKSGPGLPTSRLDFYCQTHDTCLSNAGASCLNFLNPEVNKCHGELISNIWGHND